MATPSQSAADRLRTIGDVFYETRVLMGRRYSLRRFAEDLLDARVEPVMLSYIEKGERFPSEDLVRHLAAVRREDPQVLLAMLWRDRIVRAVGKELDKAFESENTGVEVEDGELAVRLSRAMAALPDSGGWISHASWKKAFRRGGKRRKRPPAEERRLDERVEAGLLAHGLVEVADGKVRRKGRHFQGAGTEERRALAQQYSELFAKGLLDRVALEQVDTGTYLRNHYFNIDRSKIPEFQEALDDALRDLAERFAVSPSRDSEFMNVLTTATPR